MFGSRFVHASKIVDYPAHKLIVNRMTNWLINIIFGIRSNDLTNAFKLYRRHAIQAMEPQISPYFNLTVEMPLKAIVGGYDYAVWLSWTNRQSGISKFIKIEEMSGRYLFIVLYLWLEKHLSIGHRKFRNESTPHV